MNQSRKAVVLVSGGLDSATVLAIARQQGFATFALSFDYGQRHRAELAAAQRVAQQIGAIEHKIVSLGLDAIGGSALTDTTLAVPTQGAHTQQIPITYVPARNTIFLSLALGWAEVIGAQDLFIGVNAVDYSGYPDCRREFIDAFARMANLATKAGIEGQVFHIHTPLIELTKAQIIQKGIALGVDFALTVSCYQADGTGQACGVCDSCRIRKQGFSDAAVEDVTRYVTGA